MVDEASASALVEEEVWGTIDMGEEDTICIEDLGEEKTIYLEDMGLDEENTICIEDIIEVIDVVGEGSTEVNLAVEEEVYQGILVFFETIMFL